MTGWVMENEFHFDLKEELRKLPEKPGIFTLVFGCGILQSDKLRFIGLIGMGL